MASDAEPGSPPPAHSPGRLGRRLAMRVLNGSGLLLFLLMVARALAELGGSGSIGEAWAELCDGFHRLHLADQVLLQEAALYPREDLGPAFAALGALGLLAGLMGWALLERGFREAEPFRAILWRRGAILALGFVAYSLFGFDVNYPARFHLQVIPQPGFFMDRADAPANLLCQCLIPALILSVLAGFALSGVWMRFLLAVAAFIPGLLYPLIASWFWADDGWLMRLRVVDFGGAGAIHLTTGAVGAAFLVLSRRDARPDPNPRGWIWTLSALILMQAAFAALQLGSVRVASGILLAKSLAVGGIAAGAGLAAAGLLRGFFRDRSWLQALSFGAGGGWVIVSGGSYELALWQAAVLGAVAGALIILSLAGLERAGLRDPFAVVPVHGLCGALGLAAVAWTSCPGVELDRQLAGAATVFAVAGGLGLALAAFGRRFLTYKEPSTQG